MPSKKNHSVWSADGRTLPNVRPHTKVKHEVLAEYIQNWVETLVGHGRVGVKALTIIDAFCGGGLYRDGKEFWEGSPIQMIRQVEQALCSLHSRRPYLLTDYKFIFIDKQQDHTDCLKKQIIDAGFEQYLLDGRCEVFTDNFLQRSDVYIEKVRSRGGHSFFFLDPFNLEVTPELTKKIFRLKRTEVFLNHMVSGMLRVLNRPEDSYNEFLRNYGYPESLKQEFKFKGIERYTLLREETIRIYRQCSRAQYVHTFAVISKQKPVYFLIHLSNRGTALEVMRRVTWAHNNLDFTYQYGLYGYGRISNPEHVQNLTLLDTESQNQQFCIDLLSEQLGNHLNPDEPAPFSVLYDETLQENPATKRHYMNAIEQLRQDKDILVFRNGKVTTAKNLDSADVIRRVEKQYALFNLSEVRHHRSSNESVNNNDSVRRKRTQNTQDITQLEIGVTLDDC